MIKRLYSLCFVACLLLCLGGCTANGIYHTVAPGQTLYRIAKTYEVDERHLARVNGIHDPRKLKAGQRIFIPNVTHIRHVPVPAPPPKPTVRPAPSQSVASTPKPAASRSASKPQATVSKPVASSKPASPSRKTTNGKPTKGVFDWPAQGKVVSKFGAKSGQANKGIEIAVKEGSGVKAAAPGKVIYSGSGIRGYGNLIIIEHADDYFTVYGYNKKNLVKSNDFVGKGDRIAFAGVPPKGGSARLHFEIRRGKTAVNPILYLP